MDIKTFRAKSMQDALALVRRELGPDAAVLHTRELNAGLVRRLMFGRQYEVAASAMVNVPSRLPAHLREPHIAAASCRAFQQDVARSPQQDAAAMSHVAGQLDRLQQMVDKLCSQVTTNPKHDLPETLFRVFTDMIEAEVDEAIARELIDRLRGDSAAHIADTLLLKSHVAQMLEDEIRVTGPLATTGDKCRLVALVGPTGVGKTTTIAKLAANYRLREKKRVGLITVDTYRVAAVEQLRTYADIIDLPMEVVATAREMREAASRMRHLDLVLMDTAGRSPHDDIKIQELRAVLAEAEPDDVLLVLSTTAGARSLLTTAERFADVGTTGLLFTKLDEATSLGHLIAVTRGCGLPVSYLTDGQNVPDDIQVAERRRMASLMLGLEALGAGR
jgi:flagellar biosynthesis protein FlhF